MLLSIQCTEFVQFIWLCTSFWRRGTLRVRHCDWEWNSMTLTCTQTHTAVLQRPKQPHLSGYWISNKSLQSNDTYTTAHVFDLVLEWAMKWKNPTYREVNFIRSWEQTCLRVGPRTMLSRFSVLRDLSSGRKKRKKQRKLFSSWKVHHSVMKKAVMMLHSDTSISVFIICSS